MQPDGSFEVEEIVVSSKTGLIKDEKDTYIFPDYARDLTIINDTRNSDLIDFCEACIKLKLNTLVLCERVAHVYWLSGLFKKRGITRFQFITGQDTLKCRIKAKEEFADSKIDILIASSIFDEGEDLKNIGAVALAGIGQSMVKQVQRIGRGVRRKEGTNLCPIWFPVDTDNKFSKSHSISRLEYLDASHVTNNQVEGEWYPYLKELMKETAHLS